MAELSSCVEMLLENDQELLEAAIETLLKVIYFIWLFYYISLQ